jgi:hypothetical protein
MLDPRAPRVRGPTRSQELLRERRRDVAHRCQHGNAAKLRFDAEPSDERAQPGEGIEEAWTTRRAFEVERASYSKRTSRGRQGPWAKAMLYWAVTNSPTRTCHATSLGQSVVVDSSAAAAGVHGSRPIHTWPLSAEHMERVVEQLLDTTWVMPAGLRDHAPTECRFKWMSTLDQVHGSALLEEKYWVHTFDLWPNQIPSV